MTESASASVADENSGTIPVSCVPYRGARGFATLVVEKRGEEIVLDAQVTNGCMIILDEAGATVLFDLLGA
jgi:hypothetical protein